MSNLLTAWRTVFKIAAQGVWLKGILKNSDFRLKSRHVNNFTLVFDHSGKPGALSIMSEPLWNQFLNKESKIDFIPDVLKDHEEITMFILITTETQPSLKPGIPSLDDDHIVIELNTHCIVANLHMLKSKRCYPSGWLAE